VETLTYPPKGYRIERGLMWPADDRDCAAVVFSTTGDMNHALTHCRGRELVVQAGGNCGVWPLWLADKFARVVTFEPDPTNFRALVMNTSTAPNVLAIPAALGFASGKWCDLDRIPGNGGAHQVKPGNVAPVLALDDLRLPACDLIYLDVEGSEIDALFGGWHTIQTFRPVIAVEDKGLSERYGYSKGKVVEHLKNSFGYEVVARPNRDVIMVPPR
jgi:FkbM family methyltransferase